MSTSYESGNEPMRLTTGGLDIPGRAHRDDRAESLDAQSFSTSLKIVFVDVGPDVVCPASGQV